MSVYEAKSSTVQPNVPLIKAENDYKMLKDMYLPSFTSSSWGKILNQGTRLGS